MQAGIFNAAALPGVQAALDIRIMSPHVLDVGSDCCEAMHAKKLAYYSEHFVELSAQGIRHRPLAISCSGRLHIETVSVLTAVAQKAARRHGLADYVPILQRLQQATGVACKSGCFHGAGLLATPSR